METFFASLFVIGIIMTLFGVMLDEDGAFVVGLFLIIVSVVIGLPLAIVNNKEAEQKELLESTTLEYKGLRPEYEIELLDQNNVLISNGREVKVVAFDSIQNYIINDNQ